MMVLGLTGSIGMGKSTVARMLGRHGIPSFDADRGVHRLLGPKGAAVAAVAARFGADLIGDAGIDRARLRERVFGQQSQIHQLERLLHPLVATLEWRFLQQQARRRCRVAVLDVPLLLEAGGRQRVDRVMVVTAPSRVQRARVLRRRGMSEAVLKAILARQMPDREKRRRADFVITSGLGYGVSERQVRRAVRRLKSCRGRVWGPGWRRPRREGNRP